MIKFFRPAKQIKISYSVPKIGHKNSVTVELKIYDDLGNKIANLVNEEKECGTYELEFDISELKKGIYFYQVYSGSFVSVREMFEVK